MNQAVEARRIHDFMIRVSNRLLNKHLLTAISAWRDVAAEAGAIQDLMKRSAISFVQKGKKVGFEHWRDIVAEELAESRKNAGAMAKVLNSALFAGWSLWYDDYIETKKKKAIFVRVMNSAMTSAWSFWREYYLDKKEMDQKNKQCFARILNSALYSAWQALYNKYPQTYNFVSDILQQIKKKNTLRRSAPRSTIADICNV